MTESDSSNWVLVQAKTKGKPSLIRFRQFPSGLPKAAYPNRLSIFWQLSEPDVNGLPKDEEFDRLARFEDRVVDAVERDQHSLFTLVVSGNGANEFVFYTADVKGFIERLKQIQKEGEPYPTHVLRSEDSDWSYFLAAIPENVRHTIGG